MTDDEKLEYWANVLMGEWVQNQQKIGIETIDVGTFAMIKQGVVMGLETPIPTDEAWKNHLKPEPKI